MTMRTTPKTPYEIRLELLQLAQSILITQRQSTRSDDAIAAAPTTEEIVAEAEKMNVFVSSSTGCGISKEPTYPRSN